MSNGKTMIIHLIVGLINKILYKMSQCFREPYEPLLKSAILPLLQADWFLKYCHKLQDVFKWLSIYSIKLDISIATSVSLALFTCVLSILLMQSVNGVQFSKITFIIALFASAYAAEVFVNNIVYLTSMYGLL